MSGETGTTPNNVKDAIDKCVQFVATLKQYLDENRQTIDPASRMFLASAAELISGLLATIGVLSTKMLADSERAKQVDAVNRELKEHLS